jgi:hypothetical protein
MPGLKPWSRYQIEEFAAVGTVDGGTLGYEGNSA